MQPSRFTPHPALALLREPQKHKAAVRSQGPKGRYAFLMKWAVGQERSAAEEGAALGTSGRLATLEAFSWQVSLGATFLMSLPCERTIIIIYSPSVFSSYVFAL